MLLQRQLADARGNGCHSLRCGTDVAESRVKLRRRILYHRGQFIPSARVEAIHRHRCRDRANDITLDIANGCSDCAHIRSKFASIERIAVRPDCPEFRAQARPIAQRSRSESLELGRNAMGRLTRDQMPSQPLYKQVKDQIVESLIRNEWRPGKMIPSEKPLAARYEVGISTVRAATGELAASGVLIRARGKGTYVAHHSARDNTYRFFNVVRNNGDKEPFYRERLSLRKERADVNTAARLRFPHGRRSPQIYRLKDQTQRHLPGIRAR